MARVPQGPPEGYRERAIGGTLLVALDSAFDALSTALGMGTLHVWASAQPNAQAMHGRGVAWATRLTNGEEVVVRHSRHGGMLRHLTRDLFLPPTRAPEELANSERLRAAGVRTPRVIGFAVYSAVGPFCRADVVTERVDGVDLASALNESPVERREAIGDTIGRLLDNLADSGAIHADLNARNVLIERGASGSEAWAIDVDRVTFGRGSTAEARRQNAHRLLRSLMKLMRGGALRIDLGACTEFAKRARLFDGVMGEVQP